MSELLDKLNFIDIPNGHYEIGWHYTSDLPDNITELLSGFMDLDVILTRFSENRNVDMSKFSVSKELISFAEFIGDPYELTGVDTISDVCNVLDGILAKHGYRLPTEEEIEVAAGGKLFPWGMDFPEGIPYANETDFTGHKRPSDNGLILIEDPYKVEIVRTAFKFGDGGSAICGAYPWPVPWLSFAPSYRLLDYDIEDCMPEFLEGAFFRCVRINIT